MEGLAMTEINLETGKNVLLFAYSNAKANNVNVKKHLWKHMLQMIKEGTKNFVVYANYELRLHNIFYLTASEVINELKKEYPYIHLYGYIMYQNWAKNLKEVKLSSVYDDISLIPVQSSYPECLMELISENIFYKVISYTYTAKFRVSNFAQACGIPVINIYNEIYPNMIMNIKDASIRRMYQEIKNQEDAVKEQLSSCGEDKLTAFLRYRESVETLLHRCIEERSIK